MNFDDLHQQLDELENEHRLRKLVPRATKGIHIVEPDGRELINFGSNDYLGFAAQRTTSPTLTGSTASALVCGWTDLHQQLADALSDFESTESAVLFPTGYAACSGTVACLAQRGDLILSDQLNHASLIDGCRLSRADCQVYRHNDVEHVQQLLESHRGQFNRIWIVTDSVFSMDGDVAPLRELCELADEFDAHLLVDEAHATGVLGNTGSGLCEALGLKDRIHVRIGTLSKALGSQGGFVVGPKVVVDYLINRCRSLIFSTALAPSAVQSALDAIKIIRNDSSRREHLQRLSRRVREHVDAPTRAVQRTWTPIVPVVIGDDSQAVALSQELSERGFYVPAIRPPTVPAGTARLRISLSAAHTKPMVQSLLDALMERLSNRS